MRKIYINELRKAIQLGFFPPKIFNKSEFKFGMLFQELIWVVFNLI